MTEPCLRLSDSARIAVAALLGRELLAAWGRARSAGAGRGELTGILAARLDRVAKGFEPRRTAATTPSARMRAQRRFHPEKPPGRPGVVEDDAMTAGDFIGRGQELDRLHLLLGGARDRRPATLFLAGEAGVGKTRLLGRFAEQAAGAGAFVLHGECIGLGGGVIPYAPLIEALRLFVGRVGEDEARRLAGEGWTQLRALISDFTGREPDLRRPGILGSQIQVFGTVMRVLRHLGDHRPVVLIFENMHWTDPSTLDLVSYLTRSENDDRTLLICSHRTDLAEDHPLRQVLAEPDFTRRIERMTLGRFTEAELPAFLNSLAPADRDQVRRGYELSEGNAFFAEQLLLSGALADPGSARVPESLQELMLSRVRLLSKNASRLLSIAATAARRVSYRLLASVSRLDEDALDDALRECLTHGMLAFDSAHGAYVVRHALLREAVYENELPDTLIRRHTAMAEAISANTELSLEEDLSSAVELAHHWYCANRKPDALTATLRAGALTARMRAFHEAQTQYDRALALWKAVPQPQELAGAPRTYVLTAAADASRWAGHVNHAVDLIREAIVEVDAVARPREAADLHERLGSFLWEAGGSQESAAAFREAQRLLDLDPAQGEVDARVLAGLATAETRAGRYTESLRLARQAALVAREVGADTERGRAMNTAGVALTMLGRAQEGVGLLREAVEIARRAEHLEGLFRAYGNLGVALEHSGDLPGAAEVALEGLAEARSLGLAYARQAGVLANNASVAMVLVGDWDQAARLLAESLADRPPVRESAYLRLTLAEVEVARGDFAAVDRLVGEVADQQHTDPRFLGALYACQAELALWRGDPAGALATAVGGLDALDSSENDLVYLRLCAVGARAAADLGQAAAGPESVPGEDAREQARSLADRALRSGLQEPVLPEVEAVLRQCTVERDRALGRDSAADWEQLALDWERMGRPYPAAYARLRQAAAALAADDPDTAVRLAADALQVAENLGAAPLAAELRKLAEPAGQAGTPAAPAPPEDLRTLLTRRQLEVARLIALGHSYQKIALELHLANGTVARHLADIYRNLRPYGADNNVALANWIRDNGLLGDASGGLEGGVR
ncbi:MAG TPA: AAA family ATPase [Actinocrinis sp.]|nr:AAA family ATPase [Actinocrinis sp.]